MAPRDLTVAPQATPMDLAAAHVVCAGYYTNRRRASLHEQMIKESIYQHGRDSHTRRNNSPTYTCFTQSLQIEGTQTTEKDMRRGRE